MAIILRLDRVMADRKISLNDLSRRVGISTVNLSNLKTGKVKKYHPFFHFGCDLPGTALSTRRYFGVQTNGRMTDLS